MTAAELIEELSKVPADAPVYLRHWPSEVHSVTVDGQEDVVLR